MVQQTYPRSPKALLESGKRIQEPLIVRVLPVALSLTLLLLVACSADIKVFPEIRQFPEHLEVLARGKIVCDGDKKYLPRTVGEGRGGDDSLIIQYEYEELEAAPRYQKASEI
jgi:hypothetical protein